MMLWPVCPETKKMVQYSYSAEDFQIQVPILTSSISWNDIIKT